MTNWKILKKTTVAIALILGSSLVISAGEAEAHRKRSKIHGPFGSWTWGPDIPHIHPPSGGSSSSCLAVMSSPKKYSWYVKNTKSYKQTFYIDGKKYVLGSGKTRYFTSKVGRSASNSCDSGITYKKPTIEFDRYSSDGKYTAKKFVVDVTNYRGFKFWKDGSIIKFSINKSTRR